MQQEHRGSVDETSVPEPRTGDHDGVAVGTAHAPDHDHDSDHDHDADLDHDHNADRDHDGETYPAGTYSSATAGADGSVGAGQDRDDVEVVDRDTALAEERAADQPDVLVAHPGEDVIGERVDDDVRDEEAVTDTEPADEDEDEEVHTAEVEQSEDEGWEAEHPGTADVERSDTALDDDATGGDPTGDGPTAADTAAVETPTDDTADREWAAEHATQLRAGSVDASETSEASEASDAADAGSVDEHVDTAVDGTAVDGTTADDVDDVDDVDDTDLAETAYGSEVVDAGEPAFVPVPAGVADRGEDAAVSEAPGGLRPGAVEAAPIGAFWADGAADELRGRWRELQLRFIDEPRSVAGEADQLIAEAVSSVTAALESQRRQLSAWQSEETGDTERLRAAVRQYRDFLDRLLGL